MHMKREMGKVQMTRRREMAVRNTGAGMVRGSMRMSPYLRSSC